ncbi:hypothetical protein EG68_11498 [Paragonimus skrjabini miyazakii]|uniref:Serpin domain-containing protein n=1 Tax=Paragonimus skrjabini miyazakii TaxID=59628 RepID=A0A8S9YH94_9TREM|nr:hypothetical protein EG68_11498 [Paragonimus skrjabini miyazakii]
MKAVEYNIVDEASLPMPSCWLPPTEWVRMNRSLALLFPSETRRDKLRDHSVLWHLEGGLNVWKSTNMSMSYERSIDLSVTRFTGRFYGELIAKQAGGLENTLISPMGLFVAMMMTKSLTGDVPFYTLTGRQTNVPMMYRNGVCQICSMRNTKDQVIKLPFADPKWELVILLPKARDGLPKSLDDVLNVSLFQNIMGCDFINKTIDLYIPRFKLSGKKYIDASSILQTLGIRELFSTRADFSPFTTTTGVSVSNVFHKAIMKVQLHFCQRLCLSVD